MRLYLVRHPKPDIGSGICYGRTDVAVAPHEQALALKTLLPALPQRAPLYSSPAVRCTGLAASVAAALDCAPPILDARLAEMDFGGWEMRAWDDIPRAEVDAWAADLSGYRPGGGESVLQVAQRVQAFHRDLLKLRHESAIVICHAGTIRLLLAIQRGLPPEALAFYAARTPHTINYAEPVILDC